MTAEPATRQGFRSGAAAPVLLQRRSRARRWITVAVGADRLWTWLTRAVLAYCALYVVNVLAPVGLSDDAQMWFSDVGFLFPGLAVAALSARAAFRRHSSRASRRAWLWLAAAFFAFWLGDAIYVYYDIVARTQPSPSLADLAYLAYYPLLLVGLLSFPRVMRTVAERSRFVLDALTVALGGGMAVWYFLLAPIASGEATDLMTTVLATAYPVGDLVLLLGIGVLASRGSSALARPVVGLLLGGLVVSLTADLVYGAQSIDGSYASGSFADMLYILAWATLAGAAYRAYFGGLVEQRATSREPLQDSIPLLPYLSVALGYGLLLIGLGDHWTFTRAGLALGAFCLTGLVVARQVTSVRESLRLVALQATQRSEARFRSLVQNASDVIVVVDRDGIITFATTSVERMLGHTAGQLVGRPLAGSVHLDDQRLMNSLLATVAGTPGATATYEVRLVHSDGRSLIVEASALNLLDDPDISGNVVTVRNVDDRKQLEIKLAHQAHHDPLTGLATRSLFMGNVAAELALGRERHQTIGVLYLDIDALKTINDSLGHRAGDRALVEVGRRIKNVLRPNDGIGRMGGDEFAVLLTGMVTLPVASAVCQRIQAALEDPFLLEGVEITLSASIGICLSEPGVDTPDVLLRNADIAMYLAKMNGKAGFVVFEAGMQLPARERLDLGASLRHALERDEFEVFYQPIVELATGRAVGAEALLRWHRDGRELVLPNTFIGFAEETGLIVPIGLWVLNQACHTAQEWSGGAEVSARRADGAPFVSVNVSARQLDDLGFADDVAEVLQRTSLDPRRLILEITESMIMTQPELTIERLRMLKSLGIGIAIDDFGTGYSSLSYLRRLPVDEVKIDRSFIVDLDRAVGAALVDGIINLSRTLSMSCIAEGVETKAQASTLNAFGCLLAQGFYFGRPCPGTEIAASFASQLVTAAA